MNVKRKPLKSISYRISIDFSNDEDKGRELLKNAKLS